MRPISTLNMCVDGCRFSKVGISYLLKTKIKDLRKIEMVVPRNERNCKTSGKVNTE